MIFGELIGHYEACRRASRQLSRGRCSKRPLLLEALEGRLCPGVLTLTPSSISKGFGISTFATDFPVQFGVGVTSVLFPDQGGELVTDGGGNVRLFPSDSDGQSAAYVAPRLSVDPGDALALAKLGGKVYMTQQSSGKLVQFDDTLSFVREVVNNLYNPSGMVANLRNGHLIVDDGTYSIYDIDPKAATSKQLVQNVSDYGLAITPDGKTLYAAGTVDNHVMGYDTTTGNINFDSGTIAGGPSGLALGIGRFFGGHLYVSTMDGSLLDIDLASHSQTMIASGGQRGDFLTFDPNDGSLLVTQTDRIVRVKFPRGPATSFQIDASSSVLSGQPFVATVTALDADGRVVTGYTGTVKFTSSDAYPGLLPPDYTFTPGDNSTQDFAAVFFTAGTQTLTVQDKANGLVVGSRMFAVQPLPVSHLKITAPQSSTVAGSRFDLTVAALDPYGNADPTYTGTVTFTSTDPAAGVVLPADYRFVAADKGTHTFSGGVTLLTAQARTITVRDKSNGNFTDSVSLLVIPAPATRLLVLAPSAAVAGTAFNVTVTALDPYGNADSNYTGTVTFRSTDTYPGLLPSDYTFSAIDNGTHTFAGVTLFTAQANVLTVQDTANGSLTTSVPVTVSPAPPSQFVIAAPASVDASSPFIITVTLYDAYGNLETNYTDTVTFTSTDPKALLPRDYTYTPADKGTRSFAVVFSTPGDQTLTIIDKVGGIIGSVTITVTSPGAPPGGGGRGPRTPTMTAGMAPTLDRPSAPQIVLLDRLFSSPSVRNPTFVLTRFGHNKLADDPFDGHDGMLT